MKRLAQVAVLVALATVLCSCSYLEERAKDLSDIIDFSLGYGGLGIGVKVQATDLVAYAIGAGYHSKRFEKFGRSVLNGSNWKYLHLLLVGVDGCGEISGHYVPDSSYQLYLLCENVTETSRLQEGKAFKHIMIWSRFRFGAEVLLGPIICGLYLNLGELVDFLLGIFGADVMDDDEKDFLVEAK